MGSHIRQSFNCPEIILEMKNTGKLKILTIVLSMIARASNSDIFSELKVSLEALQNTVDKMNLEQIKTNEKVESLQNEIGSLRDTVDEMSLEQNKTNGKLDRLQNEVGSLREDFNKTEKCAMTKVNTLDIRKPKSKPIFQKLSYSPEYINIAQTGVIPTKGNLVQTIGEMGPAFHIKFDFLVTSFEGPTWRNIILFTNTDNNCCNLGDRIPAVFSRNDGRIRFDMHFHKDATLFDVYHTAKINIWYSTEIMQYYDRNEWKYEIRVDGNLIYQNTIPSDAPTYKNVKVYIGGKFHDPGLVKIKNFKYGNLSLEMPSENCL